jgi:hypothetical protein
MPRLKKKDVLIPIPKERETLSNPSEETPVQKAIKKSKAKKAEKIVVQDDSESETEFTIEQIQKPISSQPIEKVVEKIVEKPVEKIVEKIVQVEKPVDIFKTEQWIKETKKYNDSLRKLQKENEILKKLGSHVDHLSRLSNMSRQMKIKF